MKIINLGSFRVKVTLAFILSMLFAAILSNFLIYRFTSKLQFEQLKDKLMIIAQTAALAIDGDILEQVPLNKEGVNSLQYKIIADKLIKIRRANPLIRDIYTMTKTDKEGILQFWVDPVPEPINEVQKKKGLSSYPGDKYDTKAFPEMVKAFQGPTVDQQIGVDEWGATLSGYAPVRNKDGKTIAILGVDVFAKDVYKIQREVNHRALFVLFLGVIFSISLGSLLSRRVSEPIKKLVEGTHYLAQGNLRYRVQVKGANEIKELADSFNEMASSLYEARKKLHSYFYGVVQMLINILEAKDPYTKGHSERVSEYTEKIALKMGFSKEKIEMLKEAAVLHDIGKLGIDEAILNKKGMLTEEEWKLIHEHPVVGEKILKPVLITDEMAQIIKEHHERYDGGGYPDKLDGKNINLLAQILSVADSYDAMTSSRSYRPALSKEKAIEELKKNKGTQFDPKIVDVFIEVLNEQSSFPPK